MYIISMLSIYKLPNNTGRTCYMASRETVFILAVDLYFHVLIVGASFLINLHILPHLSQGALPVLTTVSYDFRSSLRRMILPSAKPV